MKQHIQIVKGKFESAVYVDRSLVMTNKNINEINTAIEILELSKTEHTVYHVDDVWLLKRDYPKDFHSVSSHLRNV